MRNTTEQEFNTKCEDRIKDDKGSIYCQIFDTGKNSTWFFFDVPTGLYPGWKDHYKMFNITIPEERSAAFKLIKNLEQRDNKA